MFIEVSSKVELDKQVSQHERVLAFFASLHCPFCQRFAKIFDTHITKCNIDLTVHVNMDDFNSPLWDQYNVNAIPTLILFENSIIKNRLNASSGTGLTEQQFTEWIKTINTPPPTTR